jgi:hypothetical protein
MKTMLCQQNVSGYEQELSMLFPKHPYFLLIGLKTNAWRLACRKASFETNFLNFLISACQPPFIRFNAYQ